MTGGSSSGSSFLGTCMAAGFHNEKARHMPGFLLIEVSVKIEYRRRRRRHRRHRGRR